MKPRRGRPKKVELDFGVLEQVWHKHPGKFFGLAMKRRDGKFFRRGFIDQDRAHEWLEENKIGNDIYANVNKFETKEILNKTTVWGDYYYADLDETDPEKLGDFSPTIAIESSPKRFVGLWHCQTQAKPEINQALAHKLCKDKTGWEGAKVLRLIPGAINYKYPDEPRVRLLWDVGLCFSEEDIKEFSGYNERRRLRLTSSRSSPKTQNNTKKLSHVEWEKKLGVKVMKMINEGEEVPLKNKDTGVIDRSGVSNYLINLMAEKNFPQSVAKEFMDRWNETTGKFKDMEGEVERLYGKAGIGEDGLPLDETDSDDFVISQTMDQIEEKEVDWIWPNILARGEITILDGNPGAGKSYFTHLMAVDVCDGKRLPLLSSKEDKISYKRISPLKVYVCDFENSAAHVTKPRLRKAGMENFSHFIQCEHVFSVKDTKFMNKIREDLERHRPDIMIFDTVNSYLGNVDSFKGHEVTNALNEMKKLAREFNMAVLVLRHLRKTRHEEALHAGQGSVAFAGVARVMMLLGRDPEDDSTVLVTQIKNNLGPMYRDTSLSYTLDEEGMRFQDITRGISAEESIAPRDAEKIKAGGSAKKMAEEFLTETLDQGPVEFKEIMQSAEARGMNLGTIHRASISLKIVKKMIGARETRTSWWQLPDSTGDVKGKTR